MMSKKDQKKDTELPQEEALPVEEPATEPAPETAAETDPEPQAVADTVPRPARKSGSGGVAWLALLLSLVASAGIGYKLVQDWRAQGDADQNASSLAELRSGITASNESLANLDNKHSQLAQADTRAAAELERLRQDFDKRLELLDSLPARMSSFENSLATLQGVSTGARDTWLLAEAEYYMQIANAQLQLAGNSHFAALALGMADERLVRLANPALTDVRRALSDELAALEVMGQPDIEGATLTLASLARVVDALPLRHMQQSETIDEAAVDPDLSGADRAWASVKGAVANLVRVTPPDETAIPLLTPDAIYFLRTNLTLQLQAARLALLRGEQAVFEQSLDDAAAWLNTYFDAESAQVESALQTIAEIRGGMFAVTVPDISESLRLLRQFNSIAESAQ
jgi:uroporphyrin-3 C-methyltransferase